MYSKLLHFLMHNRFITLCLLLFVIALGLCFSPFYDQIGEVKTSPVAVDAIPNLGENQQIVFTKWPGRSPQDIEDQVTYPLMTALMGVPRVKTVRSSSMFGYSMIYVIFEDGVDFYWGRTRILEKLNALSEGSLPDGVKPTLGPDATALG
ncbi:MAG TPA: efflux RND transporter permease subunit [Bacteroidaceae bacterium]|nr:efflux RND transporter permease subunit [Bacteroidaceae bacterium]